jgi:poly(3-hydroxybutyrate) depolymerase
MQTQVTFQSDGLDLAGILHLPDELRPTERRPCFIVLHGFGTNKNGTTPRKVSEVLADVARVAGNQHSFSVRTRCETLRMR